MLSDFLCFVMYDIFGYRKKVVRKNLMLVFPEKDNKWYKKIERKFYHHMCDIMLETIKSFKISEKEMKKRFKIKNIEVGDYSDWINHSDHMPLIIDIEDQD